MSDTENAPATSAPGDGLTTPAITLGQVELSDVGRIEIATEEAFATLLRVSREQGLAVCEVPLTALTADGAAGQNFKDACQAAIIRLQEIAAHRAASAPGTDPAPEEASDGR